MYIDSTNIYFNLLEHNSNVSSKWDASEKYYNCENFYCHTTLKQKLRRMIGKKTK